MENIKIYPLTSWRWADFETLFESNGNCSNCWCTWWLLANKEFNTLGKDGRKETMRTVVHEGNEPGLIAYVDDLPAGWVALAPRESYIRLKTSRKLAAVDPLPVWVVSCFFIHRKYRRQQMMKDLIEAACQYARSKNAKWIEAFPIRLRGKTGSAELYTGVESVFIEQGFKVVIEREGRLIVRKML